MGTGAGNSLNVTVKYSKTIVLGPAMYMYAIKIKETFCDLTLLLVHQSINEFGYHIFDMCPVCSDTSVLVWALGLIVSLFVANSILLIKD